MREEKTGDEIRREHGEKNEGDEMGREDRRWDKKRRVEKMRVNAEKTSRRREDIDNGQDRK